MESQVNEAADKEENNAKKFSDAGISSVASTSETQVSAASNPIFKYADDISILNLDDNDALSDQHVISSISLSPRGMGDCTREDIFVLHNAANQEIYAVA